MDATQDRAQGAGNDLYLKEVAALHREFGAAVPGETIERCVHLEADRFSAARIRDYVPLFVLRGARARLRDIAAETRPASGCMRSDPELG